VRPGTGCSLGGSGGIGDGGLGPEVLVTLPAPWDALLPVGCSTVVLPPGPVVVVVVVVVCWSKHELHVFHKEYAYRSGSGDNTTCASIPISLSGYVLMA
jgi:hypothetical protein